MDRIVAIEDADGIHVSNAEEHATSSDKGDAHMRDPSHSTQGNQMEEDSQNCSMSLRRYFS
jgi:hypothetical protein